MCADEAVSVFGHTAADSDSVCSTIIIAWELQHLTPTSVYRAPNCAKAHTSSALNKEIDYILQYLNIEFPLIIEQITADTMFALDDTNNENELPDGATKYIATNLHSVVDHHKLTGSTTDTPISIDDHNRDGVGVSSEGVGGRRRTRTTCKGREKDTVRHGTETDRHDKETDRYGSTDAAGDHDYLFCAEGQPQ